MLYARSPRPSRLATAIRALSTPQLRPPTSLANIHRRTYAATQSADSPLPDAPPKKRRGRPPKNPPPLPEEPVKKPRKRTPKTAKEVPANDVSVQQSKDALSDSVPVNPWDLPPVNSWKVLFPTPAHVRPHTSVHNRETAAALANAFVPEGSRDKVIIEAYPGPGQLTRALLNLPRERVKKIIVLEDQENYLKYLHPLEKLDPRVQVIPKGGHQWETYSILENMGILGDVSNVSWTRGVHPQLTFISHLPNSVLGEQLIAQLFRSIPTRSWLFQFGRVPMHFILPVSTMGRVMEGPGANSMRCKLGIIAQATSELKETVPRRTLQPFNAHFFIRRTAKASLESQLEYTTLTAIPFEQQAIRKDQVDMWDYCVRRMLVQKATPLNKALGLLGPGGQSLLNVPSSQDLDPTKHPRQLNTQEWALVVKAFSEWPFAPTDLGIDNVFIGSEARMTN